MSFPCKSYSKDELAVYFASRPGETKVGATIGTLEGPVLPSRFDELFQAGFRYVLLGVPEDIGPRANYGHAGSHLGWESFLRVFLSMPVTEFFPQEQLVLLGEVLVDDLMREAAGEDLLPEKLRMLCSQLDTRIEQVVTPIVKAGLVPIVIGGGHNNAYPLLRSLFQGADSAIIDRGVACVNCDPHSDFRRLEGRHSGNGFRYAYEDGFLKYYHVFGLREQANAVEVMRSLSDAGFSYSSWESLVVRRECTFQEALSRLISTVPSELTLGLEVDLDAIRGMPSSAEAPYGFSVEEVATFVHRCAKELNVSYLHLAEGAPPLNADKGRRCVGKALSLLVKTFVKAREVQQSGVKQ